MKLGKRIYTILMSGLMLVAQINPNIVMAEEQQEEPILEPGEVEDASKQLETEVQEETPVPEEVKEETVLLEEEPQEEKEPVYYCGLEEHIHTKEECYETIYVLDCKEEHEHTIDCYKEVEFLVCQKEEHTHNDECLKEVTLVEEEPKEELKETYCGKEEHTHDYNCYELTEEKVLNCTEDHEHNEECYLPVSKLKCELEEYTHSEECYIQPEEEDIEWLEEEVIMPDIIETEERKPIALHRAPLKADPVSPLEIRTFNIQFFYGAEKQGNDYVWTAPSSASGHRFSFRINYAIGGKFDLEPEAIEIRIPKQILKDRDGNYADYYEMSIPSKKEVEDGEEVDMDINYAYYEDGDDIVIYNFRNVYTGENGYIELSYFTSKSTFNYYDYDKDSSTDQDKSDDFFAHIKVTGNGLTVEDESERIPVYINTNATIQSTNKLFPTKHNEWRSDWGVEPEYEAGEEDGYYYLLWEIRTYINTPTQPYNFSIADTLETEPGNIVGYKFSGQSTFSNTNLAVNQTLSANRSDYVLTRHPKSYWDTQDHWEITNSEVATVDPIDQVDPDTTAKSEVTFVWNKPHFYKPIGHFEMHKRADGWYRTVNGDLSKIPLTNIGGRSGDGNGIGHKSAEYSRYDLEKLRENQVEYLDMLDYAVWVDGYGYPWTVDGDDMDIQSYGKKPVRYELIDDKFFLMSEADGIKIINTADTTGLRQLTAEDYQIDYLYYRCWGKDTRYNGGYEEKGIEYNSEDELHIFAKFDDMANDWVEVAVIKLKDNELVYDEQYVKGLTYEKITFIDNCIAFKMTTDSKHYYAEIDAVPYIRLKNSEYVNTFIQDEESIAIYNEGRGNFYEYNTEEDSWTLIHADDPEGDVDFLRGTKRNSSIEKTILATSNVTRKKRYLINWKVDMKEHYRSGTGEEINVEQASGVFYDLLPAGSILNVDSVAVRNEKDYVDDVDIIVEQIPDYNGTGRSMMIVRVDNPGKYYMLYYETAHPWDSIKDWGNNIYNPVAFETGNADISDFNNDGNRGPQSVKEIFSEYIDGNEEKFIWDDTYYDISIITAAAANLHKKVKDSSDQDYSYDTWTLINGDYSYRWRYQNTFNTQAKDLVFFDSLENYREELEDGSAGRVSDWHGVLQLVDVSQLEAKGIKPVVYFSDVENLDLEAHHDVTDSSIWKEASTFGDITNAKAIAVDARKKPDGEDFILEKGDSVSVVIHMKAPTGAQRKDEKSYPEAYNNIYLENTIIDENGGSQHFYIHQDYTIVKLKIERDIRVLKVSEKDETKVIPKIKFRLFGTSDYGTEVDLIETTGRRGTLVFKDIEMGEYILQEYETTEDWLEDHTEHQVKIDVNGVLTIDGEEKGTREYFTITNKPRVHGDFRLQKRREATSHEQNAAIDKILANGVGTRFTLEGEDYEVMRIEGDTAYIRIAPPEFYYPELEDRGTPIASGTFTKNDSNLSWRITSGGELIFGKEGETQKVNYYYWDDSYHPSAGWVGYNSMILAARFEGNVVVDDAISGLFQDMPSLISVDFTNVDTHNMKFLESLFEKSGIMYINWGDNFDTSNLESISHMFIEANRIQYVDMSKFDTSNLSSFRLSHFDCPQLKVMDLTNWDTSKVSSYIYGFFAAGPSLKAIYVGDKWTTANMAADPYWDTFFDAMGISSSSLPNYDPNDNSIYRAYIGEGGYLSEYETFSLIKEPVVPISDTTFKLSGVSDYGNEVLKVLTTNEGGSVTFENIEKGTYELREIKENENYVLNETVWTVIIDESGNAIVQEPADESKKDRLYEVTKVSNTTYSVENEPRYWDFTLRKVDKENETIWLQGATFTLTGISDLGTSYNETQVSNENGRVVFNHIEKGTYILQETIAPTGVDETGKIGGNRNYEKDERQYIVTIDYKGKVTINGLTQNEYGDFVVKNDRIHDGKITVIKKWNDGLIGEEAINRPTPKLHLTSYEPYEARRYVVRYNANGGLFDDTVATNDMLYQPDAIRQIGDDISGDTLIEGSYKEPINRSYEFDGWYTDRKCTVPFDNKYSGNITEVYAKWKELTYTTKYAVTIYGIGHDVDENDELMGLTFGPALGTNVYNSYISHVPVGSTNGSMANDGQPHEHRCVHDDDWETIIYWNSVDPQVYEECVGNNCTHGIELTFSDLIKNPNFRFGGTGDGVSAMLIEFRLDLSISDKSQQNLTWNLLPSSTSSSGGTTEGGWGASRIRAVLNGHDDLTMIDETGYYERTGMIDALEFNEENALIGAFPEELRNAIGNRKTEYHGTFNQPTLENQEICYDKLWLLSVQEVAANYNISYSFNKFDGHKYEKFILNDVDLGVINGNPMFTAYRQSNYNNYSAYPHHYWSRAIKWGSEDNEVIFFSDHGINGGSYSLNNPRGHAAIAPCFGLSRNSQTGSTGSNNQNTTNQYQVASSNENLFTTTGIGVLDAGNPIDKIKEHDTSNKVTTESNNAKYADLNNDNNLSWTQKLGLFKTIHAEDNETSDIEYISEEGINADNHFEILDDNTWKYTFDVFDDTLQYYLYEEYMEGYTSDAMAPNYITVKKDEENYITYVTNHKPNSTTNITLSKKVESGKQYIIDEAGNIIYTDDDSVIPESEKNREFEFTIKLTGPNITGTQIFSDVGFNNGIGKVKLKDGETKVIEGLPLDTSYEVLETVPTGYTNEIENQSGDAYELVPGIGFARKYSYTENLSEDGTQNSNYGNRWNDSNIRGTERGDTSKAHVVTIPGADELTVTITYGGESSSWDWVCMWAGSHPEYNASNNAGSSLTGQLGGGSHTSPSNTKTYTVSGDTVTFSFRSDGSGYGDGYGYYAVIEGIGEIMIPTPTNPEVTATNTYHERKIEPVDITVKKQVKGNVTPSDEDTYQMYLLLTGLDIEKTYNLSNGETFTSNRNGEANVSIQLKNNEEVKVEKIPVGATYQVMEVAGKYVSSFEVTDNNGNTSITQSKGSNTSENKDLSTSVETAEEGEDVVITFTNEINKYQNLKLTKKVVSDETSNKEFEFTIELFKLKPNTRYDSSIGRLISDGDGYIEREVLLKDGDTVEFYNLPVGSAYTITEKDYAKEGFVSRIQVGNGVEETSNTISNLIEEDINTDILFTNVERTVISGTKKWVDEGIPHDNTEEIELVLLRSIDGRTYEEVKDVVPEWKHNTYYFTDLEREDENHNTYTYKVEEKEITNYTSEVQYEEETNTYNFTNTKDKGKLIIEKVVEGNDIDTNKEFTFTITLKKEDGTPLSGTFNEVEFNKEGVGTVKLKHGQSKVIETYVNVSYTIEEDPEDYEVDSNNIEGTITKDTQTYTFTNTRNTYGELEVSKKVEGNKKDTEKAFNFTVTLSDTSITGEYGEMTFKDGKAEFALKDTETKKASNLPNGITYTVEESDYTQEGYVSHYEGSNTGTIKGNTKQAVTYINTINKEGSLTITKQIKGNDSSADDEFVFEIVLDEPITGTYSEVTFTEGKANITLKGNESKTIEGLPEGTGYTVNETDSKGYTSSHTGNTGKISSEEISIVSFTNEKNKEEKYTSYEVIKVWKDENNKAGYRPSSIAIQLYGNGQKVGSPVILNEGNGWRYKWEKLEEGLSYSVVETKIPERYIVHIQPGTKKSTITNEYQEPETPPTPPVPPKPPVNPPRVEIPNTGDNTQLGLYVVLLLGALGIILMSRKVIKETHLVSNIVGNNPK